MQRLRSSCVAWARTPVDNRMPKEQDVSLMRKTKTAAATKLSPVELMEWGLAQTGRISLCLTMRLKNPKTGQWGHYSGGSLTVQTTSVANAKEFVEKLREAGIRLAREMGLTLPGVIVVHDQ